MSLRKSTLSGLFWTFTQQFSAKGISFFVSILLARILLPSEFGLLAMIGVFTNLGTNLVDSGLSQSLIRSRYLGKKDYSTIFFFNVIVSIVIYLLIYLSAPLIARFYEQHQLINIIRVYALIIVISGLCSIQMTYLTKSMQFRKQMVIEIPALVISSGIGVVFAKLGFGVWSLIYMGLLHSAIRGGQLWASSQWWPKLKYFSIKRLRYHFKFGINLTFASLIHTAYVNVYSLIIGKYISPSTLGYYERANALKSVFVNNLSEALNKVLFPTFAQISDDNVRMKRAYKLIMTQVFFWVTPIMLFSMIYAEPLIRLVFTEKWLPMVPYFQILCIVGILTPIQTYNVNVLKIKGRSDLFLRLEIVKKSIFVVGVVVSLKYGIYGLLWNLVISSIIGLLINSYYSGRYIAYPLWEQIRDLLSTIIIGTVTALLLYLVVCVLGFYYNFSDPIMIIGGFILFSIVYAILNFIFKTSPLGNFLEIVTKKKQRNGS